MDRCIAHRYQPKCVLKAAGPDARAFLQGQFSADLGKSVGGERVYGLWLDRKGKIVADSFVLCQSPDEYWIVSYFCDDSVVRGRLEDFLIMDEVELESRTGGMEGLTLWGKAIEIASSLLAVSIPSPSSGEWISDSSSVIFWGRRGRDPALEILLMGPEASGRIAELVTKLEERGVGFCDEEALERLAIEDCSPRVGLDVGERDLPQEVGLVAEAVAFDKGCYLGQEVMARLRSMGRARKRLAKARFSAAPPTLPALLYEDSGKRRGEMRSCAKFENGYVGLAIVSVDAPDKLGFDDGQGEVVIEAEG